MNKKLLFYLIILVHLLVWFILKPAWPFSDDYCYASHASHLTDGSFHLSHDAFQSRFGVYFPTSFFFYCFGINPYTISLWPLIASLLTITIVYILILKIADESTALISSFLLSMNTLQILYSTALFPDIFIGLYSIAIILLLYYGKEIKPNKKTIPLLFVLFIFIGILTKETIFLTFPFITLIAITDLLKKRCSIFWKRTLIYTGIFSVLFFASFYFLTGDAFFKIRILFSGSSALYSDSMHQFMLANYSHNILKWLNNELGLIFILLYSLSILLTIKKYDLQNFKVFMSVYSFSLLLFLGILFYTDKYGVLFMMDRVWLITITPLCILTALFIKNTHQHFCVVLIVILSVLVWYNFNELSIRRGLLFTLFLVITLLTYYLTRKNVKWNIILLTPFLFVAINFVNGNSNYKAGSLQSGDEIKNQLEELNKTGKKIIITDKDFSENHIVYNGFKEYSNLIFSSFEKYDSTNQSRNVYVVVNNEDFAIPDFITNNSSKWKKEFDSKKLLIYKRVE
jgi:hypothetical protein